MAAMVPPTKFRVPLNSHLLCPVCKQLFKDPVISVSCGHTFCRNCISVGLASGKTTKCPVDGGESAIRLQDLVINRAVLGQIDDLEIHCQHGCVWSESDQAYMVDLNGCQEIIKLGNRSEHEDVCEFALLNCPNNGPNCQNIRRRDINHHEDVCTHAKCPNYLKGCTFTGTKVSVSQHLVICGFRGLQSIPTQEIEHLRKENTELRQNIAQLTEQVQVLQESKKNLTAQLEKHNSLLTALHQKVDRLESTIDRGSPRRSWNADGEKRGSRSSESRITRTTSTSSLSGSPPGTLTNKKLEKWMMPFTFKCIGTLRGHSGPVHCLATYKNRLFSSGKDKCIKIWCLDSLAQGCTQTMKGHIDTIHSLTSGDGFLFSVGADFSIRKWNLDTLEEVGKVQSAHDNVIRAIVYTKDYIFTSSYATIKVWESSSLKRVHTIEGLHHWVRALAVNETKDKVYSGSHNTIEIWDASGKFSLKGKVDHQYGSVHSLVVTQKYIIIGTYNQNVQVYDIQTQQHTTSLIGHIGTVGCLLTSPSGRFLFSASVDTTIQVYSLENMLPIQSLSRHEGSVNALALHGDLLLSGSEDCEIKVYKHFEMQMGFTPT